MGKTSFQKEVQNKLTELNKISNKMHRKHFTCASFNRKFRSILKFSKLNENSFEEN